MNVSKIKNFLKPLMRLPIHPQWYTSDNSYLISELGNIPAGSLILDVGCYDKWPKKYIEKSCSYFGLDYFETASYWYLTTPDVFADAHRLPICSQVLDAVLIFDVLEHIQEVSTVLGEINRVLKQDGIVIIRIPFLYPLHDTPRDFSRITIYGMRYLASQTGFVVTKELPVGRPLETATLLKNIAATQVTLNWIKDKNPLAILALALPFYILLGNLVSFLLSRLSKTSDFMPHSYSFVLQKK